MDRMMKNEQERVVFGEWRVLTFYHPFSNISIITKIIKIGDSSLDFEIGNPMIEKLILPLESHTTHAYMYSWNCFP